MLRQARQSLIFSQHINSTKLTGVPGGNDGNGAERMKSVGIMALFLFCVSVMFY